MRWLGAMRAIGPTGCERSGTRAHRVLVLTVLLGYGAVMFVGGTRDDGLAMPPPRPRARALEASQTPVLAHSAEHSLRQQAEKGQVQPSEGGADSGGIHGGGRCNGVEYRGDGTVCAPGSYKMLYIRRSAPSST